MGMFVRNAGIGALLGLSLQLMAVYTVIVQEMNPHLHKDRCAWQVFVECI